VASCACGLTWRMMRRASQIATEALQLCTMMSGSPNIAQPSPNRSERGAKLSSVIVLVDCSIAIDPIKYIRIPFSFDDFKPDSNIIDNDGMPGKPSSPAGSVFGSFSHFMILSFWFADKAHRRAPCWRPSRSSCELNFFSFRSSLILHREITGAMPACAMRPSMQPWVTISLVLNLGSRHGPLRRGTGGSRFGASAASPVHQPRTRPAVIDVSIRGVLVSQIAVGAAQASIGQPKRAPRDLLRRSQLVCKTNGTDTMSTSSRAMNHPRNSESA